MEEYLRSSEAFAKALKGFQTSPSDKIRFAKEAWGRADVVLPHKQEFLLEWLCSALVKASTPTKNPKDTSSNILLDQDHWELLRDMLSGIVQNRKTRRGLGLNSGASNSEAADGQAPSVLLRVPVIPMFTAFVQRLAPRTTSASTPTASTKHGKKSKTPASAEDSAAETPSATVLSSVSTCFDLLSSPLMSEWFQPTLEQYTPLVQATLEALVDMVQESSKVGTEKQAIMMAFSHIVLDRFKRLVVIQPNQKKVFALVAGKMFEALVRARIAIPSFPGASASECQEAIGAILKTGLFHQEHLQEYTAGYIAADEKSIQSYQKQLFEQIATLIKSDHSTAVLDVLPVLLRLFVEESRRRQRGLANSGFDRGMESARETEFSFFKIIYILAKKQLPHLTEGPSEESIGELANIMEAHNQLLATILELNMYQPSNDESADQFVFMSTSFGSIYSCLTTAQTLSNGRLQSISLAGIVVLAQLDDRLLKPHLDSLWPVLLCPLQAAESAALELGKTLLEIYGKASDLKIFLNSLFVSLRGYLTRSEELKASPLFSKAFLDIVPTNIRNYMPLPQAPTILDIFVTELMTLDSAMDFGALESIPESSHKKKRKLNSGKSKDDVDDSSHIASAELVTSLFIQFLKGLRITANQEKQLNKEFGAVYNHFLKPIFDRLADGDLERSRSYQERRLTPALKLHYALCKISTQYWLAGVSMELMQSIIGTVQGTSGWTDATALVLNRVVLQHVHLTLCSAEIMDDGLTQHCRDLVRFTMKASRLERLLDDNSLVSESWDGRLESASGNSFLVASWQIQVNDWLDIVCRYGTTQDMQLISQIIARQFSSPCDMMDSSTYAITIQLLNQILLRSANFYEVPHFRPIFAQTVLQHLAKLIAALSGTETERKLAVMISSFTETTDPSTDFGSKATFVDALNLLVEIKQERTQAKSRKSKSMSAKGSAEEHGPKLLSLLSIMHLLPLEYFEKYERNIILTTMAVLEHYIVGHLDADTTGIRCLLLERRVANAIMTWRGDAGVLTHDPAIWTSMLTYPTWNCSSNYGIEDKDGLGRALMDTSSRIIDTVIRFCMAQTQDPAQYKVAFKNLGVVMDSSQEWAAADLTESRTTFDNRISVARIRVVLLSHLCRTLVSCLEQQQHRKSKSKSNSTSLSSTVVEDMEFKRKAFSEQIGKLFEAVHGKVSTRIGEVVSLLKSASKSSKGKGQISSAALVEKAQQCKDHFELYKTVVQYHQVSDEEGQRIKCLSLVPDLFLLASALLQPIIGHEEGNSDQLSSANVSHLAALLTAYSCQYLPLSHAWQLTEGADKTLKELLVLLVKISSQDLQEQDMKLLKDAYLTMLGLISDEQFEAVLHWLLEEASASGTDHVDELVLVRYLEATFLSAHHTQKRKVRRQISKLSTRLTQILQSTQSVPVVVGILDIMAGVCSEPSFELRSWEIGLILEGITSLMSPATPLLLLGTVASPLTNRDTSSIFTALYHVLINVARFRQEELMTLIPVFTAIVQGMFHGFKSLHASIAKRQQGVESLIKSPFMLLSAGALHPVTLHTSLPSGTDASARAVAPIGDPITVECAENFARLLTALGSKGVSPLGSYGSNNNSSPEEPMSMAGTSSSTSSFAITTDASKAFGKHAPYILLEYFNIQCSVVASISLQSLRNALLPGLYALMNLCSDWEREMIMVGLDNTGKTLLKGLYADYLKYHKYTGR